MARKAKPKVHFAEGRKPVKGKLKVACGKTVKSENATGTFDLITCPICRRKAQW